MEYRIHARRRGTVSPRIDQMILYESGRPCRLFGVLQDITEHRRALEELKRSEQELRESRQQLHIVLTTLPVGVLVTDGAGDVILANPAAKRIWGE